MKCNKIAYNNIHSAGKAVRRMFKEDGKHRRSYHCPHCKKWHLTSQEIRGKP